MITAYGDAETKRKALENGAEALLTKPIDFGHVRVPDFKCPLQSDHHQRPAAGFKLTLAVTPSPRHPAANGGA